MLGLEEPLTRRKGLHFKGFLALLFRLENCSFFADSILDGIHLLHEFVYTLTLRLLSIRSGKQTRGFFVFIAIEKVHFTDIEELQSMHAVIDMGLADDRLQFIFLLRVAFSVSLILLSVCIGLEVPNEVFSSNQPKILKRRVEQNLIPIASLILQFLNLPSDQLILQQFLHLLLTWKLVGRNENPLLEKAIILLQVGLWLLCVFLKRGDGKRLGVALVGDHLGEFYEVFGVFSSVE